jgi:peptide deformylase
MKLGPIYKIQRPKRIQVMKTQWFSHPKMFKTQKSSSKVLEHVFWDKDGILLVDYMKKSKTIAAKYYVAHLDKL